MAQKVHPFAFRLGVVTNWKSRWFNNKKNQYSKFLKQDVEVRGFILKQLRKASIDTVEIEHSANLVNVIIKTARPGLIIGRGGEGVERLKKLICKILCKNDPKLSEKNVRIEIVEIRQPTMHAAIVAEDMAGQIEKRMPYRRVMKQALDKVMQNKEVQGAKVQIKGRLNGAEIARKEWLKRGRIALQTLRSDIDHAQATAFTTYGTVGIKVWIYKGEMFDDDEKSKKQ